MWEMTGIRVVRRFLVLSTSPLLAGSSSRDDGGAAAAAGLLQQAPHCPQGISALKIEGTIAGSAIDDSRTVAAGRPSAHVELRGCFGSDF